MGIIVNISYCFVLNNKKYQRFGQYVAEVEYEECKFSDTELKQMALYNEFGSDIDENETLLNTLLNQAEFEFIEVC